MIHEGSVANQTKIQCWYMVNYIKNSAKYISLDKILFGTEHAHNNKGKKKKGL